MHPRSEYKNSCKKMCLIHAKLRHSSENTQRDLSNELPTPQGLDGFQTSLLSFALDESSLSI